MICASFEASAGSQHSNGSQFSAGELAAVAASSWTRCRRIGERRGSRAGGGLEDMDAVAKQARNGGKRLRVSRGGICWMVFIVVMSMEALSVLFGSDS